MELGFENLEEVGVKLTGEGTINNFASIIEGECRRENQKERENADEKK